MLAPRFTPAVGGVEVHIEELSKELVKRGHEVTIYTSNYLNFKEKEKLPRSMDYEERDGLKIYRFNGFYLNKNIDATMIIPRMLFKAMFVRDFDLIHSHVYGYFTSVVGAMCFKLMGKKVILTAHYSPVSVLSDRLRLYYDKMVGIFTLRNCNKAISITSIEKREFIERSHLDPDHFVIIPNGLVLEGWDKKHDSAKLRDRFGIEKDDKIILTVCRLARSKGLEYLAQAIPMIVKSIPNARFVIVGTDWGMKEEMESIAKQAGCSSRLIFTGQITETDDKTAMFKEADLFLLPSIGEAFGIVYLEAMAAGIPIVAARAGGVPDIITDQENGIMVEPKNPEAIAGAVEKLISDQKLSKQIVKNNLEKVKRFSWKLIAERVEQVYQEEL